jgi:hypothetical protein
MEKKICRILPIVIVLGLISGFFGGNSFAAKKAKTGNLNVKITDNNGKLLYYADVTVNSISKTTHANGVAKFFKMVPGDYSISVKKADCLDYSGTVTIKSGKTTKIIVKLTKILYPGDLMVIVENKTYDDLIGAEVTVNGETKLINQYGFVDFENLLEGNYVVACGKTGYIDKSLTVTVKGLESNSIIIHLEESLTPKGELNVFLRDEMGFWLPNVSVIVNGETRVTNSSGSLSFYNLDVKKYEMTMSFDGYATQTATISVLDIENGVTVFDGILMTEVIGEPTIIFTEVPQYGVGGYLKGKVTGVSPSLYRVAVYIHVNGWWTKPFWNNPLTTINSDGTFVCNIDTGGWDQNASQVVAFVVPKDYYPPSLGGGGFPDLGDNYVAMLQVNR